MKCWPFMDFVDEAHGNEHHARSDVGMLIKHEVEVSKFNRYFTLLFGTFAGRSMLKFKFGIHQNPIVEFIASVDNCTGVIDG